MNKLNKIFLIGNGFDIGHSLKTSYSDFIEWYIKKCIQKAIQNKTCKYEDDCLSLSIGRGYLNPINKDKIGPFIDEIFKKKQLKGYLTDNKLPDTIFSGFDFAIKPNNDFVSRILKDYLNQDWSGIEHEIYYFIKNAHNNVKINFTGGDLRNHVPYNNSTDKIKDLNNSVESLKNNLALYLNTQNKPNKDISSW